MAKITFVSCVISTLTKCQTFMEVFYINICGLISRDKFLYETRVLDNTYLRFKVKLPISDHNAEITAGGLKITLGAPCPWTPQWKSLCTQSEYFTISNCVFDINFLALAVYEILGGSKFTLGGPAPAGRFLAEIFLYQKHVLVHS